MLVEEDKVWGRIGAESDSEGRSLVNEVAVSEVEVSVSDVWVDESCSDYINQFP